MENQDTYQTFSQAYDALKDAIKDAAEQRLRLAKLEAGEKGAILTGRLVFVVIVAVIALFTVLFLSIALGLYLGHLMQSTLTGFAIVAGLYLLVMFVLILARRTIMNKITNGVIKALFAEHPHSINQPEA